jgi:hypothetical protein
MTDYRRREGREEEVLAQIEIGLTDEWLAANRARPAALRRLMQVGKVEAKWRNGKACYVLVEPPTLSFWQRMKLYWLGEEAV